MFIDKQTDRILNLDELRCRIKLSFISLRKNRIKVAGLDEGFYEDMNTVFENKISIIKLAYSYKQDLKVLRVLQG